MRFRPLLAVGVGVSAAVAFTAAASPALAAGRNADSSVLDASGNQIAGLVGVFDNQGALQLAGGQILYGQGNVNPDAKLLSRGDIANVGQGNQATGAASNAGAAAQSRSQSVDQGEGLISIVGNQVGGLVEVADNQVLGQGAVGQLGVLQANANAPVRVLAPGDNGNVLQGNGASGTASNAGAAYQGIDRGGVADGTLIGFVGNQLAGVVGVNDDQLVGQLAGGQVGLVQLNTNVPVRVVSPGDNGDVTQGNSAAGAAANAGAAAQDNSNGGDGGLLGLAGVSFAPVSVDDSQLGAQGAAGQLGVIQVNVDLPINVLSPGQDGTLTQTNQGGATESDSGMAG
jgi:hypothetical protein